MKPVWTHLIAAGIGLAVGSFGVRMADKGLQQRADSLDHAISIFQPRHDSLVRVDTIREIKVVTLRTRGDTIIQQIVQAHPTDTVLIREVDSAATLYRQALDTLKLRVDFWRASYDTVRVQRDSAMVLLHAQRQPLVSVSFGPTASVGYDPINRKFAVVAPGFGVILRIRLPFLFSQTSAKYAQVER